MMIAGSSAAGTLDALNQRVQNTGGSHPTETIYFGGKLIALFNPSTNAWTDLIWVGDWNISTAGHLASSAPHPCDSFATSGEPTMYRMAV